MNYTFVLILLLTSAISFRGHVLAAPMNPGGNPPYWYHQQQDWHRPANEENPWRMYTEFLSANHDTGPASSQAHPYHEIHDATIPHWQSPTTPSYNLFTPGTPAQHLLEGGGFSVANEALGPMWSPPLTPSLPAEPDFAQSLIEDKHHHTSSDPFGQHSVPTQDPLHAQSSSGDHATASLAAVEGQAERAIPYGSTHGRDISLPNWKPERPSKLGRLEPTFLRELKYESPAPTFKKYRVNLFERQVIQEKINTDVFGGTLQWFNPKEEAGGTFAPTNYKPGVNKRRSRKLPWTDVATTPGSAPLDVHVTNFLAGDTPPKAGGSTLGESVAYLFWGVPKTHQQQEQGLIHYFGAGRLRTGNFKEVEDHLVRTGKWLPKEAHHLHL